MIELAPVGQPVMEDGLMIFLKLADDLKVNQQTVAGLDRPRSGYG